MPDVTVGLASFDATTSTGTQDITVAGFGTAKAALFFWTSLVSKTVVADRTSIGVGFLDGTNNGCDLVQSLDASPTTGTNREESATKCVVRSASFAGEAEFSAFITDGVRIVWTEAAGAASHMACLLFGGADVSAAVGAVDQDDSVSGLGFDPELIFFTCTGQPTAGALSESLFSIGAAFDGSSIEQGAYGQNDKTGVGTTVRTAKIYADHVGTQVLNGTETWRNQVQSFDTGGFTMAASAAGTDILTYCALNLGGLSCKIALIDSATATGDEAYTGFGFQPQAVILIASDHDTADNLEIDGTGGGLSISAFTDAAEHSMVFTSEDAVTTTNVRGGAPDKALSVYDDAGSKVAEATLASFDSDGMTLNYTTAPGAAHKYVMIAFEDPTAVAAAAFQPFVYRRRMQRLRARKR